MSTKRPALQPMSYAIVHCDVLTIYNAEREVVARFYPREFPQIIADMASVLTPSGTPKG